MNQPKISGIHLVNEQFDPENQGKSPMLNGNESSNPYLAGAMLIYLRVHSVVESSSK
jgi:hypothetical protein